MFFKGRVRRPFCKCHNSETFNFEILALVTLMSELSMLPVCLAEFIGLCASGICLKSCALLCYSVFAVFLFHQQYL